MSGMQKGSNLEFECHRCKKPVEFSVFELDQTGSKIECPYCQIAYAFNDPVLIRQLKKFEALCRQVSESEEILGNIAVGIDIGDRHIKIPYKLLLTRLSSRLDLTIGNEPFSIMFRIEPTKDLPTLLRMHDK
jgi:DNA-directed RNA polymerase subunit RPC12/RpoP